MVQAVAPGKLVLCGEYAVLESGGMGLCTAVDVPVVAAVGPSRTPRVALEALGGLPGEVSWDGAMVVPATPLPREAQREARFVLAAVARVLAHVQATPGGLRPFLLDVSRSAGVPGVSPGRKPGLGMSAAATVAAAAALLAWHHGLEGGRTAGGGAAPAPGALDLLFRLCLEAHRQTQGGLGSGIDVATSVFGEDVLVETTDSGPVVARLSWPASLDIVVAWSGRPSETVPRIARYRASRRADPRWFLDFEQRSRACTQAVVRALRAKETMPVLDALEQHARLLDALGRRLGLPMDSSEMARFRKVSRRFGVFKPSGADGGDCALLFLERPERRREAEAALRACGLVPLKVGLHARGVVIGDGRQALAGLVTPGEP